MATETWSYLIDTFEVNTRGSQVKAGSLFADHRAKIAGSANPLVAALLAAFDIPYNTWRSMNQSHILLSGSHEGSTAATEGLFAQLADEKIKDWEGGVRAVYREDTLTEKSIFPDKRRPFQQGTYESRIDTVGALAEILEDFAPLAAVQADVEAFHTLLTNTRDAQQQNEGAVAAISAQREAQRIIVCEQMYSNLGSLMVIFKNDRAQIGGYFDLSLLRRTGNALVQGGQLLAGNREGVDFGEDFKPEADTSFTLRNLSTGLAKVRFGYKEAGGSPTINIEVLAGEEKVVTALELGLTETADVLQVENHGMETVDWEIEVYHHIFMNVPGGRPAGVASFISRMFFSIIDKRQLFMA